MHKFSYDGKRTIVYWLWAIGCTVGGCLGRHRRRGTMPPRKKERHSYWGPKNVLCQISVSHNNHLCACVGRHRNGECLLVL